MEAAAEAKRKEFEDALASSGAADSGASGGKRSGPRTVVCYICGREFGQSSIGIHEKQCARKWEEAEAQKPVSERRPLPERPEVDEGASREERNEAAKAVHEAQVMVHCPGCGRRFKDEETMRKHQRSCRAGGPAERGSFGGSGGRQLPPEMEAAAEAQRKEFEAKLKAEGGGGAGGGGGKPSGPRTVVCYICGREFGKSSIGIHEKQCAKKWEEAEAQKPPHQRRPLPERPEVREGATREERNAAAKATHEAEAKVHCPFCGRSFKDEETMRKHQRSCRAGEAGQRGSFGASGGRQLPPEMEAAAEAQRKEFEAKMAAEGGGAGAGGGGGGGRPSGPRTLVCYICGREFGKSSLPIHEKQCAKKWEEAEAQKPPHLRKPLPQRPEVGEGATREERNAAAKATHEAEAMVHCPTCNRRFKDEATMRKHQKSCRGSHGGPKQGGAMLLKLFRSIDADDSGAIDSQEFVTAMQAFARVGEAMGFQVDHTFATMDKDNSGVVEFDEFEQALLPMQAIFGPRKFQAVLVALLRDVESKAV